MINLSPHEALVCLSALGVRFVCKGASVMADQNYPKGAQPAPKPEPKETKPDDKHPVFQDYASI